MLSGVKGQTLAWLAALRARMRGEFIDFFTWGFTPGFNIAGFQP